MLKSKKIFFFRVKFFCTFLDFHSLHFGYWAWEQREEEARRSQKPSRKPGLFFSQPTARMKKRWEITAWKETNFKRPLWSSGMKGLLLVYVTKTSGSATSTSWINHKVLLFLTINTLKPSMIQNLKWPSKVFRYIYIFLLFFFSKVMARPCWEEKRPKEDQRGKQ